MTSLGSDSGSASPAPIRARFPEVYERALVGPLFTPWARTLLARVPLAPTTRLLDVACGTGIVARLARAEAGGHGRVVGVDRSPGMLAVARAMDPTIDWREGDVAALPLGEDERFDAVTCHQGLQFFANKLDAVRAMRRVLAPGGHVAIGVWRAIEANGLFDDLGTIAARFVGPIDDARFSFGDAGALERLLTDAGFTAVQVESSTRETRFEIEPAVLARINAAGVVGMSARGKEADEAERAALIDAIVDASMVAIRAYSNDGAIVFPTSSNIATGHAA